MSNIIDISIMSPIRWLKCSFAQLPQYNMVHFDEDWYTRVIPQFYDIKNYAQKWQKNDIIRHQFQSTYDPIRLEVYNCKGVKITDFVATTVPTLISTSIFNVYQVEQALNTLAEGYYFLVLKIGSSEEPRFISECLDIRTIHPTTRLFQFKNSYNRQSMIFENDFEPMFRCEASVEQFLPMSDDQIYIDQSRNATAVSSYPFRAWKLLIGGTFGVPDWIIDKLSRMMGCDSFKIDGKLYSKTPTAKWEVKREQLYPWSGWAIDIQEAKNKSAIRFDEDNVNTPEDEILISYNFNTGGFGDYNGDAATNLIQIIKRG